MDKSHRENEMDLARPLPKKRAASTRLTRLTRATMNKGRTSLAFESKTFFQCQAGPRTRCRAQPQAGGANRVVVSLLFA